VRDMRLIRLQIDTKNHQRGFELDHSVISLFGPADTGKTSFVDAVAFALGMKIDLRQAMRQHVHSIELTLRLQNTLLRVRRRVGQRSEVEVLDGPGGAAEKLPLRQRDGAGETISDRLLAMLDLKELLAPAELLNGRRNQLGFPQLWPFVHVAQDEIDRQVMGHLDHDSDRVALFEAFMNLSDPHLQVLESRFKESDRNLRALRNESRILTDFMAATSVTNADTINAELAEVRSARELAVQQLAILREGGRTATRAADPLRVRVNRLRKDRRSAEDTVGETRARVDVCRTAIRSKRQRLAVASGRTYSSCPACSQSLQPGRATANRCHLCTQPMQDAPEQDTADLQADFAEANARLTAAEADLKEATDALTRILAEIKAAEDELERITEEQLSPDSAAREQLSADIGAADARIEILQRLLEPHAKLRQLEESIRVAEAERNGIAADREALKDRLAARRLVLDDLDEWFREVITALQLPWFRGEARLDRKTYLPIVDGQRFTQLGGGTKTAVNIAYSLALFRYALSQRTTHLPSLLIIDSPRKNVGANPDDHALMERIYALVVDIANVWRVGNFATGNEFGKARSYQLIVIDNDPPSTIVAKNGKIRSNTNIFPIALTHENPLIPGVVDRDVREDPPET
jgi:hypothetical protein